MMASVDERWSIVYRAQEAGVQLEPMKTKPDQYKANCPFCGDTKKHLQVNSKRDVFNCYKCNERGGVIRFYALLHKIDEASAKEALRGASSTHRRTYQHPAEKLSGKELKELGFRTVPNWFDLKKQNPKRAKALADWIWQEKQAYDRYITRWTRVFMRAIEAQKQGDELNA